MRGHPLLPIILGGLIAALPAPLPADGTSAERTAALAESCATCHGTDGRLDSAVPAIAGRAEPVLREQLLAFKRDETPGATVMPRLARGFTEEELAALAAYFAALDPDPQQE